MEMGWTCINGLVSICPYKDLKAVASYYLSAVFIWNGTKPSGGTGFWSTGFARVFHDDYPVAFGICRIGSKPPPVPEIGGGGQGHSTTGANLWGCTRYSRGNISLLAPSGGLQSWLGATSIQEVLWSQEKFMVWALKPSSASEYLLAVTRSCVNELEVSLRCFRGPFWGKGRPWAFPSFRGPPEAISTCIVGGGWGPWADAKPTKWGRL